MTALPVSLKDIERAHARVAGAARHTPNISDPELDRAVGTHVSIKAENFQRGGAFKFRGAYNRIAALDPETRERGVIAFSSGNHGIAVAIAAADHGITATIVVPRGAVAAKVAAIEKAGAEIVVRGATSSESGPYAVEMAEDRGLTLVPPFDHPDVIAGAGTVGLELADDLGEADAVLIQASGGGLFAGSAIALRAKRPELELIAVEPAGCPVVSAALAAREPVEIADPQTIADGMRVQALGKLTFPVIAELCDDVISVEDHEILIAMAVLWRELRLAVEPSGAVALAAAMRPQFSDRRIAVTVSGGNVELPMLARALGEMDRSSPGRPIQTSPTTPMEVK